MATTPDVADDSKSSPYDPASKHVLDSDARFNIPECIYWSTSQVADWLVWSGYPQYRPCFVINNITGRHLIGLEASTFPEMGITDFDHIKDITSKIRQLLGIREPIKNMNVAMADPYIAYLEMKRRTGKTSYNTSYQAFVYANRRWFK